MRTERSENQPYGDRRLEIPEGRPAFSVSQFDMADFKTIQRNALPGASLPGLELFDSRPRDSAAVTQTDGQNRLRDRVAVQYASPALAERGERFLQDMEAFNQRARTGALSAREVSDTYRNIERLLQPDSNSRLPQDLRLALASQVMHNAAEPTAIRQNEDTCSVASLEVRTYTLQPSAAAALVADMATRGTFTGTDGTTVRLDAQSLTPSSVGTILMSREANQRNFASQLFQVTAANIANMLDPNYRERRFEQIPPRRPGDSGEVQRDIETLQIVGNTPGAAGYPNGLIRASESITGRNNESQAFLVNTERQGRTSTLANHFDDIDQLGNRLEQLDRAGQLPAIIFVFANSDLFAGAASRIPAEPFQDGHFISVTGYDPVTRMVRYDDQFGPGSDHNTTPVPLRSLYEATHVVRANRWLDRLEAGGARMDQTEYVRNLEHLGRSYALRWQSYRQNGGSLPSAVEADRVMATARINALARELPPQLRQRVEQSLVAPPLVSRR